MTRYVTIDELKIAIQDAGLMKQLDDFAKALIVVEAAVHDVARQYDALPKGVRHFINLHIEIDIPDNANT